MGCGSGRGICLFFVFFAFSVFAEVSPLGKKPDWRELDRYQECITREDFLAAINFFAPRGVSVSWISVRNDGAAIARGDGRIYFLRFAANRESRKVAPRYWRGRDERAVSSRHSAKPLRGVKIALDPGHIGGKWAHLEERWFRMGNSLPVTEGDMTLLVAKKLAKNLQRAGAQVVFVRSRPAPSTWLRPWMLKSEARASLAARGKPATSFAVKKEAEKLFYRTAEIRSRAKSVNSRLRPDFVVALHFNAEAWGNPVRPSLTGKRHCHFLVSGAWSADEVAKDDQRFEMLLKLLGGVTNEEIALACSLAKSFAGATGLPPFTYTEGSAAKATHNPFVWGRNLLANRLYLCPVVYAEPYVMNSFIDFARIQAGDYAGTRMVAGVPRKSIYAEYADAAAEGIIEYYRR